MRYTVRTSVIDVLGIIWMPAVPAATILTVTDHDIVTSEPVSVRYRFTDASALWQAQYGNRDSGATAAAFRYLAARLSGEDQDIANTRKE